MFAERVLLKLCIMIQFGMSCSSSMLIVLVSHDVQSYMTLIL